MAGFFFMIIVLIFLSVIVGLIKLGAKRLMSMLAHLPYRCVALFSGFKVAFKPDVIADPQAVNIDFSQIKEWRHLNISDYFKAIKPNNYSSNIGVQDEDLLSRIPNLEAQNQKLPWVLSGGVSELVLTQKYRITPLRTVYGISTYQNPYESKYYFRTRAAYAGSQFEQALNTMVDHALGRLLFQAKQLGAQLVLDVKLVTPLQDLFKNPSECIFTGIAVSVPNIVVKEPVLCTVSCAELSKLLAIGSMPVGLGFGVGFDLQKNLPLMPFKNAEYYPLAINQFRAYVDAFRALGKHTKSLAGDGIIADLMYRQTFDIELESALQQMFDDNGAAKRPRGSTDKASISIVLALTTVIIQEANVSMPQVRSVIALNQPNLNEIKEKYA